MLQEDCLSLTSLHHQAQTEMRKWSAGAAARNGLQALLRAQLRASTLTSARGTQQNGRAAQRQLVMPCHASSREPDLPQASGCHLGVRRPWARAGGNATMACRDTAFASMGGAMAAASGTAAAAGEELGCVQLSGQCIRNRSKAASWPASHAL